LKVDLNFNGAILPDPAAVQELFTKQIQKCHYDVQAFDCHVVNKNYGIGMPQNLTGNLGDGRKMSIVVIINGAAKYFTETANQAEQKSFTDNILLVPNWDSLGVKGDKRAKKWLIQSQTFRVVV
jgi:NTF2-related export protein 1/2